MNTSRRLQFFVSRLFKYNSSCVHKLAAAQYVAHLPNMSLSTNDFPMTRLFLCRNINTMNKNKAKLETASEVNDEEIPTFKEFLSQLPSQEEFTNILMKALNCEKEDFGKIRKDNVYWRSLPIEALLERIKAFENLGVRKSDLVNHSPLLFVDFDYSYQLLKSACELLDCDGHMLFPLLLLPRKTTEIYLSQSSRESKHLGKFKNRIKYFSSKLQIPVRHFTEALADHDFLLNLPIKRITHMMDILLDAKVDREDIYRDLWVFKFNLDKAKARLNQCQLEGLKDIKPWIVRCSDKTFIKAVEHKKIAQSLSNGLSWEEFVAKHLNCSREEVEAMVKYNRRITRVSFLKTKITIDLLLSEGFSPKQIVHSPQVFSTSIKMIQKRLKMMKEAGFEPVHHAEVLRRIGFSEEAFLRTFRSYGTYNKDNTSSLQEAS